jgi:CRP-like cAMP-binding protein
MRVRGGVFSERRINPCELRPRPTGRDLDLNTVALDPFGNKLLAGLPSKDFEKLSPHMTLGSFVQGMILTDAGSEIQNVYFPLSGMISVVVVMNDGKAIETATIGREGVFGAMVGFGHLVSHARALVQVPMHAVKISVAQFRKAVQESNALQQLAVNYNEMMLAQARITAACNALHKVEARFCRWLLQTSDIVHSNTIVLTQEFLSEMLGVRRTSVTDVATKMQAAGIISYSRGVIKIIDLPSLKALSCECYETLHEQRAV